MNRLGIETIADATAFEPGAEIEVLLDWELDEPPEAVELRIVWNTAGKGDTDLQVVDTVRFDMPSAAESRRTTLQLPDSPYSFSGKLMSIVWALELVAFPSEASTRKEITIAPGGQEILIAAKDMDDAS